MEGIDRQMVELQKCAERRCRKILKPDMEFSGPVKLWHERVQAYKALIKWKEGRPCNGSNIIRTALQRGIENPRQMWLQQMKDSEKICRARKQNLRKTAAALRTNHLRTCYLEAERRQDKERARSIKARMEREGQKKMWYFISRSQKDPRCGSFHVVQKMEGDTVVESVGQEEAEDFIFDEAEYRFQLAAEAPISETKLIDQLGYLKDSDISQQLIEGSYLQNPQ